MSIVEGARSRHLVGLLGSLSETVGEPADVLLGRAVALDLRWEHGEHGLFLSGVPADVVERVAEVFHVSLAEAGPGEEPTLRLAPEWWSAQGRHGIGTGPVLDDGADDRPGVRALVLAAGPRPERAKRDQAQVLRGRFERTSASLEVALAGSIDSGALLAAIDSEHEAAAGVVGDLAESRRAVGRLLLDAGDWFDDERIDQLGDGYVRAASLWASLPDRPEPELVAEALAVEEACAQWMRGASEPPTRYAF